MIWFIVHVLYEYLFEKYNEFPTAMENHNVVEIPPRVHISL